MEYLVTTCCAEKRNDPELLPAIERYRSQRIAEIHAESERSGRSMLIFSGRYGLLAPEDRIHWYDYALIESDSEALAERMAAQLNARGATRVLFRAEPREAPGWEPYHRTLEAACERAGVSYAFRAVE